MPNQADIVSPGISSGNITGQADLRPKTVVLHQLAGIGDLIFHSPYFKTVAQKSHLGKVSIIASPSTHAHELMTESWVDGVIYYDHHPRRSENRKGRHSGLAGLWRMARELRAKKFDRIILFSAKFNRGLLAWLTHIPDRRGYGLNFYQRIFLTTPPYIKPYRGENNHIYKEATAFAIAHQFCDAPIVPRLYLSPNTVETVRQHFQQLPRPLCALVIGASESYKQWGAARFGQLASELTARGCGVALVGGPNETAPAREILAMVPEANRTAVAVLTKETLINNAALLSIADVCIGNDTGPTNMAAACGCPTYTLIGAGAALDHDPSMIMLQAKTLEEITVTEVLRRLNLPELKARKD